MKQYEGFTPGVWYKEYTPNPGGGWSDIVTDSAKIAVVTCDNAECEANAQLITAAPTILEERDALAERVETLREAASNAWMMLDGDWDAHTRARRPLRAAMDILDKALNPEISTEEMKETK